MLTCAYKLELELLNVIFDVPISFTFSEPIEMS